MVDRINHYKDERKTGSKYEYCTITDKDVFRFYSKEKFPKKYHSVISRPCDRDLNDIETWYLTDDHI